MNETDFIRIPKFMEGETLPAGYFDAPDPYSNPPRAQYNIRALVNYALKQGKQVTDLTKEEVKPFLLKNKANNSKQKAKYNNARRCRVEQGADPDFRR